MGRISKAEVLGIMSAVPLFSALTRKDLASLLAEARLQSAAAGTELLSPDEQADRFYVILAGRVKLFQLSPRGDEQILHLYGRGDTFGEAAMWVGKRFPAYAETMEEAVLLVLGREILESIIRRRPQIALGMLAGLSRKLREFNLLIEKLSLKEVPARLAAVLIELAGDAVDQTIVLRQTKRELAAQIGTIPETLSRALAKLKDAGLIEVEQQRIRILDAKRLTELAES